MLDESRYQALLANPGLFAMELRSQPARRTVVLDEVQRVPALLNEVHRAIESARRRFVLLGSSARRFKTAATNLLAGRAALRTLYPLVPAELGEHYDLERVLRFGSIPLVWQADDPRATLEAYVQLYVRERRHPKLYWVDPGLVRAAKRQLGPVGAEERGPLLEGWILTVLRAHNERSALFEDVTYWAPLQARQTEVDFLLEKLAEGRLWP